MSGRQGSWQGGAGSGQRGVYSCFSLGRSGRWVWQRICMARGRRCSRADGSTMGGIGVIACFSVPPGGAIGHGYARALGATLSWTLWLAAMLAASPGRMPSPIAYELIGPGELQILAKCLHAATDYCTPPRWPADVREVQQAWNSIATAGSGSKNNCSTQHHHHHHSNGITGGHRLITEATARSEHRAITGFRTAVPAICIQRLLRRSRDPGP